MNTKQEDVAQRITEEFNLGEYLEQESIGVSGRGIVSLATTTGRYVAKPGKDEQNAMLYSEVERTLNGKDIRQARIFNRPDGSFLSSDGYAVYEFINGTTHHNLTPVLVNAALAFLAGYNAALAEIAIPATVISLDDPWNQAASLSFLTDKAPYLIDEFATTSEVKNIIVQSIDFLSERKTQLNGPIQLIHGDAGPDNFLISDDRVTTIIDFSPHAATELFSLCQFFFWVFLWRKETTAAASDIKRSVLLFHEKRPDFFIAKGELHTTLVFVCTYRLLGPLLSMGKGFSSCGNESIQRRAELLKIVVDSDSYDLCVGC